MDFKTLRIFLVSLALSFHSLSQALETNPLMHTIQIHTNFKLNYGNPTWLLVLRDIDSQRTWPYVFDFRKRNHFWMAYITAHTYEITISQLKFGPMAIINNFCGLENCIFQDTSMLIRLNGILAPDPYGLRCSILKYSDLALTGVKKELL